MAFARPVGRSGASRASNVSRVSRRSRGVSRVVAVCSLAFAISAFAIGAAGSRAGAGAGEGRGRGRARATRDARDAFDAFDASTLPPDAFDDLDDEPLPSIHDERFAALEDALLRGHPATRDLPAAFRDMFAFVADAPTPDVAREATRLAAADADAARADSDARDPLRRAAASALADARVPVLIALGVPRADIFAARGAHQGAHRGAHQDTHHQGTQRRDADDHPTPRDPTRVNLAAPVALEVEPDGRVGARFNLGAAPDPVAVARARASSPTSIASRKMERPRMKVMERPRVKMERPRVKVMERPRVRVTTETGTRNRRNRRRFAARRSLCAARWTRSRRRKRRDATARRTL